MPVQREMFPVPNTEKEFKPLFKLGKKSVSVRGNTRKKSTMINDEVKPQKPKNIAPKVTHN